VCGEIAEREILVAILIALIAYPQDAKFPLACHKQVNGNDDSPAASDPMDYGNWLKPQITLHYVLLKHSGMAYCFYDTPKNID